ncbi:DUF453 domain protein [Pleurostoma richardsiae]|uniref:DUF453 domain protein n=1 Tax=Pleurostoma richardsiae TaxID=41990 RepID=A0AA38VD14_9PEZI|nr:DUF453 domain protein [Pleurostoma richardsiae]
MHIPSRRLHSIRRQNSLPAAYYRGGTSRAIFFHRQDLPNDQKDWEAIFRGCIGSPDPYGRQLDGMGGGISSLSKVCVVGPPSRPDADVDYTFVALGIRDTSVDYSSNCGNMSSAVGPFAVDSKMLNVPSGTQESFTVRVHNTNTGKIIHASFPVVDGEATAVGDFAIDGVAGTGARVKLDFIDPAGSRTGKLLPTGAVADDIEGVRTTCIDAGNPCCFVSAADLGVDGRLSPQQIDDHPTLKETLDLIRRQAGVRMGLASKPEDVPGSVPKIAMVSPSSGEDPGRSVVVRAMSVGQPHKAVPVTVALATAAAAKLPRSTVADCVGGQPSGDDELEIQHASGKLSVDARFDASGHLIAATVFRTARRLMEGRVFWK